MSGLTLAQQAAGFGIVDGLLFRRSTGPLWSLVGGFGCGADWAGVVDISQADDPGLGNAPTAVGEIRRFQHRQPTRVIGPYYALTGALVRVGDDALVAVGTSRTTLPMTAADQELNALASALNSEINAPDAAKLLADELEVLRVVRALNAASGRDVWATLAHAADIAAEALRCEVAVIRDGSGQIAGTSTWGPIDVCDSAMLNTALDDLTSLAAGGPVCLQDAQAEPLPEPFDWVRGARSLLIAPLPEPIGGVLVLVHTLAAPVGFTPRCRQVASHIVQATQVLAQSAMLRDELRKSSDAQTRASYQDPLTGLPNRLAWDEALRALRQPAAAAEVCAVIRLDLDGLAEVNDKHGRAAGDDLLRRCALILRESCLPGEVIARVGGDEFAVLLCGTGERPRQLLTELRRRYRAPGTTASGVAASVGLAVAAGPGRAADLVRNADAAMYEAKRARRIETAQLRAPKGPTKTWALSPAAGFQGNGRRIAS